MDNSYELESNPYTVIDQSVGWTLTTRNAKTAVTTVQTYKGADAPSPWVPGSSSSLTGETRVTVYDVSVATCSDFTDQASHITKYCYDGLGRLSGITDAAGNLTQYSYDQLDDLTKVVQAGQTRAFEYSSLGRLTKACNPESGTANCTASPLPGTGLESYTYDANGNVLTKTDARAVMTSYGGYDGLNRPHTKSYTKGGVAEGTPAVTYTYDLDWKGALSAVSSSVGNTSYSHDAFGRIRASAQTTGAAPAYNFTYTYSLADELTQLTYPSGRAVNYTPDSAGRISVVQNVANGQYYARNIAYTAAGGISAMTLGNGVTEGRSWNDRLQLTGMNAAAPQTGATLLALGLYPCAGLVTSCGTGNVGNIQAQTITLPGLNLTQNYTYDVLNRIGTAGEGTSWSRSYGYGATGNRYVVPSGSSGYNISAFTPTGTSNFDAGNHVYVNNSANDPSGNQLAIGGYLYKYDAENRLTGAYLGGGGVDISNSTYVYDGQGQRVQKIICPADPTNPSQAGAQACTAATAHADVTTYVYDAFGNVAAEYESSTKNQWSSCGTATCYVSVDQIGSTRLVTDSAGNVAQRYDYLPFGEELWAGYGGRATDMGYQAAPDGFNPKFTGQYRDPENLLDYFHARYYSPQQGRFVSTDPGNAGADVGSPQTWNGYAYVNNNPLSLTDPSGEGLFGAIFGFLGGVFGGLWGGIAGAAVGSGMDAAIWGPGAAGIPGTPFNLGSLTSCGGPLGACGSLGAGPWSEISGLGSVQDPGRFVFDLEGQSRLIGPSAYWASLTARLAATSVYTGPVLLRQHPRTVNHKITAPPPRPGEASLPTIQVHYPRTRSYADFLKCENANILGPVRK